MSLATRGLVWSGLCGWVGALLLAGEPAPARFRLEAEEVIVNKEALRKDRMTPVTWNFWTTDKDAEKKWSGCGMVTARRRRRARRRCGWCCRCRTRGRGTFGWLGRIVRLGIRRTG